MQFSTLFLTLATAASIISALPVEVKTDATAVASKENNQHEDEDYGFEEFAKRSAEPEARWCGRRGEPCWVKVKRDAIPEAEARWCGRRGEPCWVKVKRDAAPEALPAALAAAVPEAEARWCGRRGEPCWVKVKRDALPEAEARWCGRRGEPCWVKVKRMASDEI